MQFFLTIGFMISLSGVWFCIGALYMMQKTSKHVHKLHHSSLEALNHAKEAIESGQKLVDYQDGIIKKLAAANLELLKENDMLKAEIDAIKKTATTELVTAVGDIKKGSLVKRARKNKPL